jgi:hypothetical protein
MGVPEQLKLFTGLWMVGMSDSESSRKIPTGSS